MAGITAEEFARRYRILEDAVSAHLVGKPDKVTLSLICLLADGHLLIEDRPGLGKTTLASGLARAIGGRFRRVQGSPDLLPTDVTGTYVFSHVGGAWPGGQTAESSRLREGPVFSNVLLCDEINRTPPKTQASLLEAMEERQVTIFDETRSLPDPFFVVATQNPMEMAGTYPLPEAQLDRFLMRIDLGYPEREAERTVLAQQGSRRRREDVPFPVTCLAGAEIIEMIDYGNSLYTSDLLYNYVIDIVQATRDDRAEVHVGASPRAGLALLRAARVYAASQGNDHVSASHVQHVAPHVLAHRLVLKHDSLDLVAPLEQSAVQSAYVDQLVKRIPAPKMPAPR